MDTGARESRLKIAALVEIARTVGSQQAAAEAICAYVVAELGLAGASIGLVRIGGHESHLESIAAAGQLSQFIRDMSTPLAADTHATRTALGGEPIFVGNPHGVGDSDGADGVGRWRNGFGSHAYAILALAAHDGPIGVLTLEWQEPQPFPADARDDMQLFADVAALVLLCAPTSSQAARSQGAPRSCEDAELGALVANAQGLVMPAQLAAAWALPPVAHMWTAVTNAAADADSAAFAEVTSSQAGGFMLVVGSVSVATGSAALETTRSGRGVIRAAAAHGSSAREVLGMLEASARTQTGAAWASGVAAAYDSASAAVTIAQTGASAVLTLGRGGRFAVALQADTELGRQGAESPDSIQIVLPGDRVALLSGCVSRLDDPAVAAQAKRALGAAGDIGASEAAASLLALVCDDDNPAAAVVVQFAAKNARD